MGLTFLSGDSNTKTKWIAAQLKRLPETHLALGRKVLDWLFRAEFSITHREKYILEGVEVVDEIYRASRIFLEKSVENNSLSECIRLTELEYEAEAFHGLQTREEYDYRRRQILDNVPHLSSYLE